MLETLIRYSNPPTPIPPGFAFVVDRFGSYVVDEFGAYVIVEV